MLNDPVKSRIRVRDFATWIHQNQTFRQCIKGRTNATWNNVTGVQIFESPTHHQPGHQRHRSCDEPNYLKRKPVRIFNGSKTNLDGPPQLPIAQHFDADLFSRIILGFYVPCFRMGTSNSCVPAPPTTLDANRTHALIGKHRSVQQWIQLHISSILGVSLNRERD